MSDPLGDRNCVGNNTSTCLRVLPLPVGFYGTGGRFLAGACFTAGTPFGWVGSTAAVPRPPPVPGSGPRRASYQATTAPARPCLCLPVLVLPVLLVPASPVWPCLPYLHLSAMPSWTSNPAAAEAGAVNGWQGVNIHLLGAAPSRSRPFSSLIRRKKAVSSGKRARKGVSTVQSSSLSQIWKGLPKHPSSPIWTADRCLKAATVLQNILQ